ncbi:MAG TPA: hypothetical protein VH280_23745 [Verrucomicrobiae bacterium]|jgi:hypothetical protein|nr:hypothetical protein [Verrucomicrobiae bacterium]
MYFVGFILYLIGLIVSAIGNIMFLAVVFRYSTAWFFGCLWIPFASWVYFLLYTKQTWKPMLLCAAGCVAASTGVWIMASFAV